MLGSLFDQNFLFAAGGYDHGVSDDCEMDEGPYFIFPELLVQSWSNVVHQHDIFRNSSCSA